MWIRTKPDLFKHNFLRVFEKLEPGKGGHFQNQFVLREFEKWYPDIFQKSQIFKISCYGHSKNAHIKLNLDSWCRAERCEPPFIYFMGWMLRFVRNLGSRTIQPELFIHLGGAIGTLHWRYHTLCTKRLEHIVCCTVQEAGRGCQSWLATCWDC